MMVVLALLVGLAGGGALAAAAGARRTSSVVERLGFHQHIYDVALNPNADIQPAKWDQIDRLPQVADRAKLTGRLGARATDDGTVDYSWFTAVQVVIDDARYFHVLDKPRVLEGHLPVGPDDAIVNRAALQTLGLKVGDRIKVMWFGAPEQNGLPDPATAVPGEMTVSAVIQTFDDALKDPNDPTLVPVIGYGATSSASALGL